MKIILEDAPAGAVPAPVRQALENVRGCERIEAFPNTQVVGVTYDPAKTDPARLMQAAQASGTKARLLSER